MVAESEINILHQKLQATVTCILLYALHVAIISSRLMHLHGVLYETGLLHTRTDSSVNGFFSIEIDILIKIK